MSVCDELETSLECTGALFEGRGSPPDDQCGVKVVAGIGEKGAVRLAVRQTDFGMGSRSAR